MTVQPKFLSNTPASLQFSDNLFYRFEGDLAQLGAQLRVTDNGALQDQRCSLQLWACDEPFQGGEIRGVRVAEVPVIAAMPEASVQQQAPAHYPSGRDAYAMVLALVTESNDGQPVITDYVNFDMRQRFLQPCMTGNVVAQRQGRTVEVTIDGIENPRDTQNLSGSLSVELWSARESRQADAINGEWLAGINLGQLAGGQQWSQQTYSFDLSDDVPEHCVLLLREWTAEGFVTRDFRNLPAFEMPAHVLPSEQAAAVVAAPAVEAAPAPAKTTKTKSSNKADSVEANSQVSINRASEDELANVKGLNAKLARLIVAGRPYLAVDELVKVRGIGERMIQKMRSLLSL